MRFIDILRMALGNLRRNKMRTTLTVAGVVVGIGAIVFLVSLGFGLQDLMVRKVANLEALTMIKVSPGNEEGQLLTEEVADRIKGFGEVTDTSRILSSPGSFQYNDSFSDPLIAGVEPQYMALEELSMVNGTQELSEADVILSTAALDAIALSADDAIGKEIELDVYKRDEVGEITQNKETLNLKIVGVFDFEKTKKGYVHFNNLKKIGKTPYSEIKVKVAERNQVTNVRKTIESMGYPTTSVKDTVDQIDQAFMIIKSVLGGFGMIALFVAAIGIFNTMTISLLERTHEIGVMKAIGGRNKDVSRVFTTEAATIGLLGGIFGVLAGYLLGVLLGGLVNFIATSVGGEANDYFSLPIDFILIVVAFSFVVSTVAGIYPARRAAKLNPLEALRYE
ncbi:MAG: ABC transporter permease [Patescibacteria group bacterium]|nr:ABC transporter permease [Patescibacteria group bacterium]